MLARRQHAGYFSISGQVHARTMRVPRLRMPAPCPRPTMRASAISRHLAPSRAISGQVHRLLRAIDSLARPARQATNSARREAATPNRTMANPMERANPIVNVIPVERVFSANSSATPEKC